MNWMPFSHNFAKMASHNESRRKNQKKGGGLVDNEDTSTGSFSSHSPEGFSSAKKQRSLPNSSQRSAFSNFNNGAKDNNRAFLSIGHQQKQGKRAPDAGPSKPFP